MPAGSTRCSANAEWRGCQRSLLRVPWHASITASTLPSSSTAGSLSSGRQGRSGAMPTAAATAVPGPLLERESELDRHLPVRHLSVGHVASCLGHAEPLDVAHGLVRLGDGVLD